MTQQSKQVEPEQQKQQAFDAEIALYEKELVDIVAKMDKTSQRFVAATIACLKRWYPETARSYVQKQYELTHQLGKSKIAEIKRKVAELASTAARDAQHLLCNGNLWWHKSRGGGWQDHYTKGPPDGLNMAVWALAERLVPILESYGYIKKEARGGSDDEIEDAKEAKLATKPKRNDLPQLEWTEEMTKAIDVYKEDLGRATFLDSKLQQARRRKAIHAAGLLWDQV
jgi:hypothetical protein